MIMAKVKVYLRRGIREKEWFKDIANEIRDEFGEKGTWSSSPEGFVWTHKRHGGKVRFLKQYRNYADFVKIWHPSRQRFKTAQAIGDFVQWIYDNAKAYIRKIEVTVQ